MGAAAFTYDESFWPLLLVRLEGAVSDQEYAKFFAHGQATLRRRERYVSIFDMSRLELPTAEQRQRVALFTKEQAPLLREYVLGTAFVVSSPFLRMTLSVLFHLAPTPAPYVVVPTEALGVTWAIVRLQQSGFSAQAEHLRRHYCPEGQKPPR